MRHFIRTFSVLLLLVAGVLSAGAQGVQSFRDLLTAGASAPSEIQLPSNAQVLKLDNKRALLWDGTAGLLLYIDNPSGVFTNLEYGTPYYDGYTAYSISGTMNAVYEDYYYDFYISSNSSAALTFGEKGTLTPKVVTGQEAINANRQNFYCYVQMHGTMDNNKFIADDGTEFYIVETYNTGVIGKSGAGTLKAVVGDITMTNSMDFLTIIESQAWTADESSSFDAEVKSLGELKSLGYGDVRFKFEEDKVKVLSLLNNDGYVNLYLWDGSDGVLVNGYLNDSGDLDFAPGTILNGGIEAMYMGSYGNSLYYAPNYYSNHTKLFTPGNVTSFSPIKKTLAEVHETNTSTTYEFSYLAIKGKIVEGNLVDGDVSIPLLNTACPTADLMKYEGKTGTFYGLYQSQGGEYLLPISEYYFLEEDTPTEKKVYSIAELRQVSDNDTYTLPLAAENDYQMQVLAVNGSIVYLWDGENGLVAIDPTESFQQQHVGTFMYGDVKFEVSNPYGDGNEYVINFASIQQFSEVADFLPAVERTTPVEGDFVKFSATIEGDTDEGGWQSITVNDKKYWISDDLIDVEGTLADYVGKTGTITAIFTGDYEEEGFLSVYPDNWFVEDTPEYEELTSLDAIYKQTEAGKYKFNVPADGDYKVQFLALNGDKVYLYDGTDVFRFTLASVANAPRKVKVISVADRVGAYVSGEMIISLGGEEDLLDPSTINFSEKQELMAPIAKTYVTKRYDYIEYESTVEMSGNTPVASIDNQYFVLSDELIDETIDFKAMEGETGKMKLIIDGMYAYVYPSDWITTVETGINEVETADSAATVYSIDGRRVQKANLQRGIYIQNGKKVAIK